MTKKVNIRRIIGITALVLWVVAIVPKFFLGEDMLIWQLDNWALIMAPLLTIVYAVLLTVHLGRDKHWTIKLIEWISCVFVIYVCAGILYAFILLGHSKKLWSNNDYVVYDEPVDFFESHYTLFKRDGFVNHRMYCLCYNVCDEVKKADYTIYDSLDLIKEEMDYVPYDSDSVRHLTSFYRLSDTYYYEQIQNDSLFALIK